MIKSKAKKQRSKERKKQNFINLWVFKLSVKVFFMSLHTYYHDIDQQAHDIEQQIQEEEGVKKANKFSRFKIAVIWICLIGLLGLIIFSFISLENNILTQNYIVLLV